MGYTKTTGPSVFQAKSRTEVKFLLNFDAVALITLQQEFASKISSIEKQKELIARSVKETETLFNSRMDYYFN